MGKYFNLKTSFFFFCVFFLISSCANDDTTTTNTNTVASTVTSPATTTAVAKAAVFQGVLDNLVAERKTFTGLADGSKIVFSHKFDADGKVHVTGWVRKGAAFDATPIELENGSASSVPFDASTYFSNVVLHQPDFLKIKRELEGDNDLQYVLFVPKTVDNYFIGYKIYTSPGKAFAPKQGLAATAEANPSPPKDY